MELFDSVPLNADMMPSLYAGSPESAQILSLTLKKCSHIFVIRVFQTTLAKAFRTYYMLIENYRQKYFFFLLWQFSFCLAG